MIVYAKDGPEDFPRFEILFQAQNGVEKPKKWGIFSAEVDEILQFTKNEPQARCLPGP